VIDAPPECHTGILLVAFYLRNHAGSECDTRLSGRIESPDSDVFSEPCAICAARVCIADAITVFPADSHRCIWPHPCYLGCSEPPLDTCSPNTLFESRNSPRLEKYPRFVSQDTLRKILVLPVPGPLYDFSRQSK
jgi:hypothetical protein